MNKTAVYRKSAKGTEAIAMRQHGLGPKQRSLLIMINGKRSFEELAGLSVALGNPELLLAELEAGGFIEPMPVGAEPEITAPTPLGPPITLPDAKRFAVRALTDIMGPTAEDLCLGIERARNAAEFSAATARAEAMLREAIGTAAALKFVTEVAAHQPPA